MSQPSLTPSETLERWKAISSIASAIAIPFVLAVVGYYIQKQLADEGLKKDYVSIATSILKERPDSQEPDLRRWAVEILGANSPIPFSGQAKAGLEKGPIFISVPPPRIPDPPELCMRPPRGAKIGPLVERMSKQPLASADAVAKQFDRLLAVSAEAEGEAMEDRASLACLQRYGALVKQWTAGTAAMYSSASSPALTPSAPR